MSWRADRINEIPCIIKKLNREHDNAVRKNWIAAAAMLKKRIDDLNREFKDLYDSYGEKRDEKEVEN